MANKKNKVVLGDVISSPDAPVAKNATAREHSIELKIALESNANIHSVHYTTEGGHSFNEKRNNTEYAETYTRDEILNN